jgi:hypothetical protein
MKFKSSRRLYLLLISSSKVLTEAKLSFENSQAELGCLCNQLYLARSSANDIATHPCIYYFASRFQSSNE